MKHKNFLVASVLLGGATLAISCSDENDNVLSATEKVTPVVASAYTVERELTTELPSRAEGGKMVPMTFVFKGVIDKEKDELLRVEAPENLLEYFGLKDQEDFQRFVEDSKFQRDVKVQAYTFNRLGGGVKTNPENVIAGEYSFDMRECLTGCRSQYTDSNGNKIRGRGECRFGCWMDWIGHAFD